MKHPQSDGKHVSRMRGCEKVFYWLGVEAQTLASHLDELPTALAEIEAMEDEASRRRAKVVVREALQQFRTLRSRLHLAIVNLMELCTLLETIDPSARATPMTGETAMPRRRDGCAQDSM